MIAAILSGLASWTVGDSWSGALTLAHGVFGITLGLLVPAKLRGPVRTGFKRGRTTRWLSALFGVLVISALLFGVLHATGIWFGVGYWSALWTHELISFSLIPFILWHVVSRPVRLGSAVPGLDRRAALRLGGVAVSAAALHFGQRTAAGALGLSGGARRGTGSHELASYDPSLMPTVIWLNDTRPRNTSVEGWQLEIDNTPMAIKHLWDQASPVIGKLDCTGGWWSEQAWDAVRLSALIDEPSGRSVYVESATGFSRRFPIENIAEIYLAVGYNGEPLSAGHGAPVRLVVPGRRGPEWVKWVTKVECSGRPSWLQAPLPLT